MTIDPSDYDVLVDVLAQTDALWMPPRIYSTPARCLEQPQWAAVTERRQRFRDDGVPYRAKGTTSERNATGALIGRLQTAGLLDVATRAGRRVGLRLTPRGDEVARWLSAVRMLHEAWQWLLRMSSLIALGASRHQSVREDYLAQTDYGDPLASRRLVTLEVDLLPLKAAGFVTDTADSQGRIWYYLTPEGTAAVAGPIPSFPEGLPPYSHSRWSHLYDRLRRRYDAERAVWQPDTANTIVIPTSCGVAGGAVSWRSVLADLPPLPEGWPDA